MDPSSTLFVLYGTNEVRYGVYVTGWLLFSQFFVVMFVQCMANAAIKSDILGFLV